MQTTSSPCSFRTPAAMAALLLAIFATGCRDATEPTLASFESTNTASPRAAPRYDAAALDLHARVAALFVDPFVDDSDPPRFTEARRGLVCADHSRARVDGRALVEGDLVPPGAFVLQWDLDLYCPYGSSGPLLSGRAEVLVFRDDEHGLDALLRAPSLDVLEPPLLLVDDEPARADLPTAAAAHAIASR